MAARCDGDNYGKLLAYYFPKERLVYGPSQIENRIQQDTVITEQLALWSRGGSRVIRGNLLMIPIGKSNLYVEPVFLQAEAGGLPELKRIILSSGEKIVMKPTLAECIDAIFGSGAAAIKTTDIEGEKQPVTVIPGVEEGDEGDRATGEIANLIRDAQKHYDAAQQYLRSGDWTGYGRELDALKIVLNRLAELSSADGE